ncbi:hypothetical protein [Paraburkholderia fungorum]|uniref:hypothetical protein n=1 Tax=Paraburkholderia fungorum TaxID=134537 RepID=UPI0004AAC02C|nr:hypothetical protein [Paraburkholderia fungorum]KFX63431.1 hypothetical protein KBK24_0117025 [Burkholderia sp. K24]USX08163.1 hypothetical protein NHH62_37040 [Paraburkholderia fungorum]
MILDRFNRQLHPEEKTLAKQIADKSGGQYTQAQVEDQLRIMGVSVSGTYESGAPTTLIGQAPTDSGAQWISGGTAADGKPILTQVTAQADPQLQSYILANYNSASPGGVPSQFSYQQTGSGSINITGPFTKFDKSDADFRFNRQLHPDEYAMAKKDAKIVAQQLGISEQEAEGRIVAELLRNSDQQTSNASGGVHDYEVRAIIGCQNLNCDGYKSDPQYASHDYNSQYIAGNQQAYDAGQQQLGTGLTDAGLRDQNIVYERTGKTALAVTACPVSGGVACKAAATGLGITALTNYATGKPVTTAEAIGGFVGRGIGGIYGANLSAWAGDASGWLEKAVLGITKAAPTYAGKQAGIPLGNATGLGSSVDPLLDPATNSWWGFQNTIENLKGTKK